MKKQIILKIQKPVTTNDPNIPWLVYNQTRSMLFYLSEKDVNAKIKQYMDQKFKIFVSVDLMDNKLDSAELVKDQGW